MSPPSIVLVHPLFSGNLGSVARAMKNMGLKDLRLVNPVANPKDLDAKKMSAHAKDVLQKAKTFRSLKTALKGFDLVVGTSRRKGKERSNWRSPREFAEELKSFPSKHKVAIVFGPEDSGLNNQDLALCHRILTIPSHKNFPSLNLAQAVMVVAYEIYLVNSLKKRGKAISPHPLWERGRGEGDAPPAKLEHLESMYEDLAALLSEVGFLNPQNPHRLMRLIRNLFNRARPTEKEVRIFRGICRQVRWWGHS